jgi:hypothetical protein
LFPRIFCPIIVSDPGGTVTVHDAVVAVPTLNMVVLVVGFARFLAEK